MSTAPIDDELDGDRADDPALGYRSREEPFVEGRVRVATWNLWWRFGPWERRRDAIVTTLGELEPDVVGLQEVWGEPDGADLASIIADELGGWSHVFAHRQEADGVHAGNAVVSRWPIRRSTWEALPTAGAADEHRLVLLAEVDGPRGVLPLVCTHLNWRFEHSGVRQEQVRAVCRFVADRARGDTPPVLVGDLNAEADSDEIRMLTGKAAPPVAGLAFRDAWVLAGSGAGTTWSRANPYAGRSLEPDRRIDYVLVGRARRGGVGHPVAAGLVGAEPVAGVTASDHYGVWADLRY